MRIVLDTGAFYRPALLSSLLDTRDPVVVPAIAVAERRRHLIRDGRDLAELDRYLDASRFIVEAFGRAEAVLTPYLDDPSWRRHARDAMIAAHVRDGDVLWTTNPRDFLAIGVSPAQVRGV